MWPRPTLGFAVALLLAAAFGMLAMIVRDRADSPVRVHDLRSREEARAAWG